MYCLQLIAGIILRYGTCAQFFPPVNVPSDCSIRCVTTSCSCETNCTQLECRRNCLTWKTDSEGCNTCDCETIQCPKRKCRYCSTGYMKDKYGCQTCRCKAPCPIPHCSTPCPNGYQITSEGCQTCKCIGGDHPGECPAPTGLPEICKEECSTDNDCANNEKCCGSCVRRCAAAVTSIKHGRCPKERQQSLPRPCVTECEGDNSCPGDEKCCGSCQRQCTKPLIKRRVISRSCPSRLTTLADGHKCSKRRRNLSSCTADDDCEDGRICCGLCRKRCIKGRPKYIRL
ncbi:WAP four-disulfide core domain protein 3-like isoform X2 [Watersipora subatra]|uniref:WAP four-disulfide core domain protein 3-like isoform X2 n=1 Tax=Watersipora subatra TaxID=2589382 RepID=UPI00355B5C1B